MTIAGIVVSAIGIKKYNNYKKEFRDKTSSLELKMGVNHVELVYSF